MKKSIYFLFLFLFLFGCQATPIIGPLVTGVVTWVNGEAHKYYLNDIDVIYRATKHACNKLDYQISLDEPFKNGYRLIAGNRNRFKIYIKQKEENISKLSVRIDFLGDKPYAELFYKEVDNYLSTIEYDDNGYPTKK